MAQSRSPGDHISFRMNTLRVIKIMHLPDLFDCVFETSWGVGGGQEEVSCCSISFYQPQNTP